MKRTILLVDDDILVMELYVRALVQNGFEVKHFYGPDTTFEYIDIQHPNLLAIILDLMMLPEKKFQNEDTDEGLKTGIYIYNNLKNLYPDVPIVILTNTSNQETLQQFSEEPRLKLVNKLDYPPFEFANLLSEMVKSTYESPSAG